MDNLRGAFDSSDITGEDQDWDECEEEDTRNLPPDSIGQDERRMQVRAYNHWASLLGDRTFPSIEDLEPHNLPDFGPNSVLLDFSTGIEDPAVQFLGKLLADECGTESSSIKKLSDVPPRSLLSRITDHYMQILANQAPIGFEAEFINQRGSSIMYRGILLPFSSDDETIDFIYGVINWKEIVDQVTADELLLEIDQALELGDAADAEEEAEDEAQKHSVDPVTDWADSPVEDIADLEPEGAVDAGDDDVFELGGDAEMAEEDNNEIAPFASLSGGAYSDDDLPMPDFGHFGLDDEDEDEDEEEGAGYSFASLSDYLETPAKKAIDLHGDDFDASEYAVDYDDEEPAEDLSEPYELSDPMEPFEEEVAAYEPAEDFDAAEHSDDDVADLSGYTNVEVSFGNSGADSAPVNEADADEAGAHDAIDAEPMDLSGFVADEPMDLSAYTSDIAPVADHADFSGDDEADGFGAQSDPQVETPMEATPEPVAETPVETPVEPAAEPVAEAPVEPAPQFVETSGREIEVADIDPDAGLYDCLASARELAQTARTSEDRSRQALYAAVGRAYDVSIAAQEAPEEFNELLEDSGLAVQDRAPMTPVVKLVFGVDYDKTRITEYAAVLSHAHRLNLARGSLSKYLNEAEGGLKGVVNAERRLRAEEAGKPVEKADEVRRALAKKLRELEQLTFDALSSEGPEFSLVMVRRDGTGNVSMIGEISDDIAFIERAAKKLVG